MLFLLTLQPAGIAFANGDNFYTQALPDHSIDSEIDCERMSGNDCNGVSHCLVSGHVGCDLNPFQPAADGKYASHHKTAYQSPYAVSKLPLNETFPPLRPPKRS